MHVPQRDFGHVGAAFSLEPVWLELYYVAIVLIKKLIFDVFLTFQSPIIRLFWAQSSELETQNSRSIQRSLFIAQGVAYVRGLSSI